MKQRKKRKYEPVDYTAPEFTKCWTCQNATGGCTWSMFGEPVKGWIATPEHISANGEFADTYHIHNCPEYRKDKRI